MDALAKALKNFNESERVTGKGTRSLTELETEVDVLVRASFVADPLPSTHKRSRGSLHPRVAASLADEAAVASAVALASSAAENAEHLRSPYPQDAPPEPVGEAVDAAASAAASAFHLPSTPAEIAAAVASIPVFPRPSAEDADEDEHKSARTASDSGPPPADPAQGCASFLIPPLIARPAAPSLVKSRMEKESRTRLLESLAATLLSDHCLNTLWTSLVANETAPRWNREAEDVAAEAAEKAAWALWKPANSASTGSSSASKSGKKSSKSRRSSPSRPHQSAASAEGSPQSPLSPREMRARDAFISPPSSPGSPVGSAGKRGPLSPPSASEDDEEAGGGSGGNGNGGSGSGGGPRVTSSELRKLQAVWGPVDDVDDDDDDAAIVDEKDEKEEGSTHPETPSKPVLAKNIFKGGAKGGARGECGNVAMRRSPLRRPPPMPVVAVEGETEERAAALALALGGVGGMVIPTPTKPRSRPGSASEKGRPSASAPEDATASRRISLSSCFPTLASDPDPSRPVRHLTTTERISLAGLGAYRSPIDASGARIRAAARAEGRTRVSAAAAEDLEAGERVDYLGYKAAARACEEGGAELVAKMMTAGLFNRFPRDSLGRISVRALHRFIRSQTAITRERISLACFDEEGHGVLREADLETFVVDQIPVMPMLRDIDEMFASYYSYTVVRKWLFLLDKGKRAKLNCADLVLSPIYKDFAVMRGLPYTPPPRIEGSLHLHSHISWYSPSVARAIYDMYIALDQDRNGMICATEMHGYNDRRISKLVVKRLFEEINLYPSATNPDNGLEMDYKTFLDFVIAVEHRHSVPSIEYFFKLFDLQKRGWIDTEDLRLLIRAVTERLPPEMEPPSIDAVITEVFDLVTPHSPGRVTLHDMIASGNGGYVTSILLDAALFNAYDQREWMPLPKRTIH